MSALWTAVKARLDNQTLVELTNVRDVTATTIDDDQGERAVASVTAWFPVYVQEPFDSSDDGHIDLAVTGVVAKLMAWGGSSPKLGATSWDEWKTMCKEWAGSHARARIVPTSSVPTSKRPSDAPSTPHTPWSDNERFRGLTPGTFSPTDSDGEDA